MSCFHPMPAWRSQQVGKSGKLGVTFRRREGTPSELELPCGQCIGCRLAKARTWAIRLEQERLLHANSAFLTLTYETLPENGSLRPKDMTDFLKRLRFHLGQDKIRYYQCGEYGDTTQRPHHHAIIFGYWPNDGVRLHSLHSPDDQNPLWTSRELERLWGHGHVTYGRVTYESANYVAGYVTKKLTGPLGRAAYADTGRLPPYATMSRRPGLGFRAFEKWFEHIYRFDAITLPGGKKLKPPRYFDLKMEAKRPDQYALIKAARKTAARLSTNNKGTRLTAREYYAQQRTTLHGSRDIP